MSLLKLAFCILFFLPLTLHAQELQEADTELPEKLVSIFDEAVLMASRGEWDEVEKLLNEAERLYPDNEEIQNYKNSLYELKQLENQYEEGAEPQQLQENESEIEKSQTEVFVINRSPEEIPDNFRLFRNYFLAFVGIKLLNIDSQNSSRIEVFNSGEAFLYSYFNVKIRGWFPFLNRSLGLVFESNGFEIRGFPIFYNKINFGMNIRGFLLEDEQSRMEIGADIGVTMNNHLVRGELERFYTPLLRVWIRDSLFYRIFNNDGLRNLVVHGYFGIYPADDGLEIDILHYGFDLSLRVANYFFGAAFDWWDNRRGKVLRTSFGLSLFMGYKF